MDKNIKNIVFDLGGVLIDLDPESCVNAFRKVGLKDTAGRDNLFRRFELGEVTPEEFRETVRRETGLQLADRKIDDMWNLMLVGIPREKLELLLELRRHYMVYLLSNTNSIHWDYAAGQLFGYHGFGVRDYFEDTFLSFEMHLIKPDEEIYRRMMHEANLLPGETFFIDDTEANCRAAEMLGMHTCLYRVNGDLAALF